MEETKKNYLFAKEILEAVSNADRNDEMAQMGRLLTIDKLSKIRGFVELCEDRGLRLTIKRAD